MKKIYFKLLHCTFITICYSAHVRTKLSYTCNLDCLRIYNSNGITRTITLNVELFYVRCSNATVLRWKRWFNKVSKSDWVCTMYIWVSECANSWNLCYWSWDWKNLCEWESLGYQHKMNDIHSCMVRVRQCQISCAKNK